MNFWINQQMAKTHSINSKISEHAIMQIPTTTTAKRVQKKLRKSCENTQSIVLVCTLVPVLSLFLSLFLFCF